MSADSGVFLSERVRWYFHFASAFWGSLCSLVWPFQCLLENDFARWTYGAVGGDFVCPIGPGQRLVNILWPITLWDSSCSLIFQFHYQEKSTIKLKHQERTENFSEDVLINECFLAKDSIQFILLYLLITITVLNCSYRTVQYVYTYGTGNMLSMLSSYTLMNKLWGKRCWNIHLTVKLLCCISIFRVLCLCYVLCLPQCHLQDVT